MNAAELATERDHHLAIARHALLHARTLESTYYGLGTRQSRREAASAISFLAKWIGSVGAADSVHEVSRTPVVSDAGAVSADKPVTPSAQELSVSAVPTSESAS